MRNWCLRIKFGNGMQIESWVDAQSEIEAAQKFFRRKRITRMLLKQQKIEEIEVKERE